MSPVISKQVADIYKATSVFPFRHWQSGLLRVALVLPLKKRTKLRVMFLVVFKL